MKPQGLIHYPVWVKPKELLIGDISYRRKSESEEWGKFIWAGKEWLPYETSTAQLKQKSELRHGLQRHVKLTRTKGLI